MLQQRVKQHVMRGEQVEYVAITGQTARDETGEQVEYVATTRHMVRHERGTS